MSFNQTLSAILRGRWLLDKAWAEAHIPLVLSMLKGNPVSLIERGGSESEDPFVIDPVTMTRYEFYKCEEGSCEANSNIPEGCIGILPITGPITKYDGECGEPGAIEYANRISDMASMSKIVAMVLLVDTPGGESRAAYSMVSALQNFKKPKLAFVDDMCASLGMWAIAGCDEIYVSSNVAQVGSIGSYCILQDWSGYFEMNGIKLHEIYAPQSTDKNKDYRDAMNGDYTLIEQELKMRVDNFISYVKTARPAAASSEKEWNTGKMFFADEAKSLGLIDGIKSLEQVVTKASWLAKRNKTS